VKAGNHSFAFIIRPYTNNNYATQTNVSPAGDSPIIATRDKMGKVSIATDNHAAQLFYMVDGGKSQAYQAPFDLRNGGKVTVWDQNNLFSKVSFSFAKIESIPLEVVYASSQETGEGDASHLVDGNPNTIWHSMYSVTVAQYPHWVDFDAGLVKNIKGFTFLPRQSGSNGNIKEYKIQISMDGKTWGEPVVEGAFPRNARLQTIRFDKPVKGRFVRFTALSAQGGEDFASGAEFSVLAD
jgi:beta-galactosidase